MKFSVIFESIAKLFTGNGFSAAGAVDKHVDQIVGSGIFNGDGSADIKLLRKIVKKT